MAETTTLAATLPFSADDLKRAEEFARERFVLDGEDPQAALTPGSARRMALEDALAEIAAGREYPSVKWRRDYSLLLGLERLLSSDEPRLADGTVLSAHQVDALSGTLVALSAELQGRRGAREGEAAGENAERDPSAAAAGSASEGADVHEPAGADAAVGEDEEFVAGDEEPIDWDETEHDELHARDVEEDPGAARRFWFEHATGAGKTVAALGFVDASRTGGVLILTHRRNLVDQFLGELRDRGYGDRIRPPRLAPDDDPPADGPVTVETYQWFVRNAGRISDAYTVVICDEAHTALGEKTSEAIRRWVGPVFIGMTATGALIARHVTDLFPTQTSRFDLAQAARRGVIAPLRAIRIPPGPGVRSIAKVPLRRGEVDQDFDQEELAALLDQQPFNLAIADLYKSRFRGLPGVIYAAGVKHAHNVAEALRAVGVRAVAVSGETPKRELARILASYERCEIDVLVNAQLLAEGWNSPKATVCMHLAPTASRRVYQQRVGRVTRKHPQKEAGIVVDFVHPATPNDDPVVTLHSLLDRDVYRGGAIVVGPVRRARGRRIRVEKRVVPVTADPERRAQVFERELWRIAVEHLPWGEQQAWAMLAGARVSQANWRRAKAMLHFDRSGELRKLFLLNCLRRNRNTQLRLKALQEIGALRDPEAFDEAVETVGSWARDERREGVRTLLQILADRPIGRREQAARWLWHLAEFSREVHEHYATQRWPEAKRLLGLLVNSSGAAHGRNARKLVQAAREQDRRLQAALLAAAAVHTPEAQQVLDHARMRLARKPQAVARELLRNFPKGKRKRGGRKRKRAETDATAVAPLSPEQQVPEAAAADALAAEAAASGGGDAGGGSVRPEDVVPGAVPAALDTAADASGEVGASDHTDGDASDRTNEGGAAGETDTGPGGGESAAGAAAA